MADFALRLPAYAGVVAARERADNPTDGIDFDADDREVDSSAESLAADPIFSSVIDFD